MFRNRPPRLTPFLRETNPAQAQDSARALVRTAGVVVVAAATAAAFALPAPGSPSTSFDIGTVTVANGSAPTVDEAVPAGPVVHPVPTR